MQIQLIKTLIISIIYLHFSVIAVNEEQKLVIATIGSSVTAGITGYSQDEINNSSNDSIFTHFKKHINSIRLFSYLHSEFNIANILINKTKKNADKLEIIHGFNAFTASNNTCFSHIKKPNFIALHLYKLINDPWFYLRLQLDYVARNHTNVIIGIDMFFWIVYSKSTDEYEQEYLEISEHKKIKTLKKFLELLNTDCNSKINFIFGNIPKVSFISLRNYYSPDPAIIDHANYILQEWVTCRNYSNNAKAILIDITKTYTTAKTDNKPFQLHNDMPAYTRNELLTTDNLHLSIKGVNILVTYITKTLADSDIEIMHELGIIFDN